MATSITATHSTSETTKGIVLMIVGVLTIQMVDGLAKHLSGTYSPLFISSARYAIASVIVLPIAFAVHGRKIFPGEQIGANLLRTVFIIGAMTLYFLAIARIPLATAISAYFVAPIVAVILSMLILKERMTARKGISLVLGFAGSMVILQPGGALEPGILLALGSGVFFAFYMIASRQAAQGSEVLKMLAFQCVIGMLLLVPQGIVFWQAPPPADLLLFFLIGLLSTVSHALTIYAFRLADASTLAPLLYVELLGAAVIGYVFFGDIPGLTTVLGAALIVIGGLVLLQRRKTPILPAA
ncbi:DMT family transporter [Mesorhizobium sp. LHD-90]|uniref:DMT family transporter n=1 Tax=Mesorhizobium sp. LHD-90 TaxID=3071414 RepID=UPI0027E14129|nr:DMT family transporter [Mesorhizobium sp. LHD-90]MDQ6432631.1 DMT family transporter [Mesorhizobium sp. LHD-90]